MSRYIALIPAAGVGARFGAGKPKQYVDIGGQTVLQHTLDIFLTSPLIDHVAVVLSPEDGVFQTASSGKLSVLRCGGETRALTVRNGVAALLESGLAQPDDQILVHDAARCCLPTAALARLLQQAGGHAEGGILAVPVADTLKRADGGRHIAGTVSRADLWQAQTPDVSGGFAATGFVCRGFERGYGRGVRSRKIGYFAAAGRGRCTQYQADAAARRRLGRPAIAKPLKISWETG